MKWFIATICSPIVFPGVVRRSMPKSMQSQSVLLNLGWFDLLWTCFTCWWVNKVTERINCWLVIIMRMRSDFEAAFCRMKSLHSFSVLRHTYWQNMGWISEVHHVAIPKHHLGFPFVTWFSVKQSRFEHIIYYCMHKRWPLSIPDVAEKFLLFLLTVDIELEFLWNILVLDCPKSI